MLGGTHFLGPTLDGTFLDRGHDVTLLNRGPTNLHLFTYLERLRGDREDERGTGLDALRGRDWDIVIDTWQKGPKCVEDTARLLSGHVGAYFYVSSIAVYHSSAYEEIGSAETAPLPPQQHSVRFVHVEHVTAAQASPTGRAVEPACSPTSPLLGRTQPPDVVFSPRIAQV